MQVSKLEARMLKSLLNLPHRSYSKRQWFVGKNKTHAHILEGRLWRNMNAGTYRCTFETRTVSIRRQVNA